MTDRAGSVLGIGNAIVDVIAHRDDAFLEQNQLQKGIMTLIEEPQAESLYRQMQGAVTCSGGSVANTMVGLASLRVNSVYVGKVKDDPLGKVYRADIQAAGVHSEVIAATEGPSTGRCMIFVTPDAQRTMGTFLGASAMLEPDDIRPEPIQDADILILEGYLFDRKPARESFYKAARIAHAAQRKVAISLSDARCVERHLADFRDLVAHHVDVVLANDAEVMALYQTEDLQQALSLLRAQCELAAVTLGAKGSLVVTPEQVIPIAAEPVKQLVDTTGAGDLYAAGFLYGWVRGQAPAACGRMGSLVAAEIVQQFGARASGCLWSLLQHHQAGAC